MSIKNWEESDKPREKLLGYGGHALSDAELIAILLGSGTKDENVLALSQRILLHAKNNLHQLGKMKPSDLKQFKGIGDSKAVVLLAALELGKRKSISDAAIIEKITCAKEAYDVLAPFFIDLDFEEFWCVFLNNNNKCLRCIRISQGGLTSTSVDVRKIFKYALELGAISIILAHNHPSGSLKPSESDIALTKKIYEGAKILDLRIVDHLIITTGGFYSFADAGLL